MQPLSAKQLAAILGALIVAGSPAVIANGGVTTDSRKLPDGAVFFALRGPTFDGDGFAAAALTGGARVAVVHAWNGPAPDGTAVIVVPDTLLALQRLACWWRQQLTRPQRSSWGPL